ncbi:MAG: DUF2807 domain-containing protein [Bacteroidota bacterium]|nr:DUF2807 domain-containing protein [Bacteroidota bacterium]
MKTSNILLTGFLTFFFLVITWFVVKAKFHINTSYIEISGNTVKKSLDVEPFNKILVQGKFKVFLVQDNEQQLEVITDENIFPEVIAEVIGGELVLRLRNNIKDENRVTVNITIPEINSLEFSAGASLSSGSNLKGEKLKINSYAGSEGNLELQYNSIDCDSNAGSSLVLSGNAKRVKINSSAGSRVDAGNLRADSYTVDGNAGSHVEVHADYELTASMSSGGYLGYSGDPEKKNFNSSSGGSISKK